MNFSDALVFMLPSFCLCVLMVGILSYLGIHVIKREIIFVDLALAQIAALGALIAFLFGIPLHTQASYWFSVALTAVAAAVFTLSRTRESRVPQEAVIGLVYAIAAATAIVLIDTAPHGAEHVKDIFTGSILWVTWPTVALVAAVYAVVGIFHFLCRRQFLLISEDVDAAQARGLKVGLWDFLFYISFGFVITVSVGSAGVLLVFVLLVAPAVMAVMITDRLIYQLLFGWVLGVAATIAGLMASYVANLPTGPLVIAAYAVALVLVSAAVYVIRSADRLDAIKRTAAVAAGFVICSAVLFLAGRGIGSRFQGHPHHHGHGKPPVDEHRHAAVGDEHGGHIRPEAGEEGADATGYAGDVAELVQHFEQSDDPGERSDIVCEALRADPKAGASLALRYLSGDPPLFFAQTVVEHLDAALDEPTGFDVEQPFSAPVNQLAAQRVRAHSGLR